MLPLPNKLNVFVERTNCYYVGLDCVWHENASVPSMSRLLMKKFNQIQSYCRLYKKEVVVVCNSANIPEEIAGLLLVLRVKIQSVVKTPENTRLYGDYYVNENPKKFLADHTSAVLVLKLKEDEYDIEENEKDTPILELVYKTDKTYNTTTVNPEDTVKDYRKIARPNNDPYGVFDLGEQGRRIFDNYYKRIMIAPEPSPGPKPLRIGNS